MDNFEDLFELEKNSRAGEITELLKEVEDYDALIMEGSEQFQNKYDSLSEDLEMLLDYDDDHSDVMAEINALIDD